MSSYQTSNIFKELLLDLKVNGWNNRSWITAMSIMLFCPAMHLLFIYRLRYRAFEIPLLGKTISRFLGLISYWISSCQISPRAILHPGISFPHPLGIVIGREVVVHAGCQIYQHVTLGEGADGKFPIIGEATCIYSGAKIVGGISIGSESIIGANAVVVKGFDGKSVIAGVPAKLLRKL
jgi:serine O-acetyltransferase